MHIFGSICQRVRVFPSLPANKPANPPRPAKQVPKKPFVSKLRLEILFLFSVIFYSFKAFFADAARGRRHVSKSSQPLQSPSLMQIPSCINLYLLARSEAAPAHKSAKDAHLSAPINNCRRLDSTDLAEVRTSSKRLPIILPFSCYRL